MGKQFPETQEGAESDHVLHTTTRKIRRHGYLVMIFGMMGCLRFARELMHDKTNAHWWLFMISILLIISGIFWVWPFPKFLQRKISE